MLLDQDRPRVYELSYDAQTNSIMLKMTQEAYKCVQGYLLNTDIIKNYNSEFTFVHTSDENTKWGYDGVIDVLTNPEVKGCVVGAIKLPAIFGRSAIDHYRERVERISRNDYAIVASLGILSSCLWNYIIDNPDSGVANKKQLIAIETIGYRDSQRGMAISVSLAPSTLGIIRDRVEQTALDLIESNMVIAYSQMCGRSVISRYRFDVHLNQGIAFHLTCPGDGCGLDPEHNYRDDGSRGYSLHPHNVDSPMQALTLLVGMATLHDICLRYSD